MILIVQPGRLFGLNLKYQSPLEFLKVIPNPYQNQIVILLDNTPTFLQMAFDKYESKIPAYKAMRYHVQGKHSISFYDLFFEELAPTFILQSVSYDSKHIYLIDPKLYPNSFIEFDPFRTKVVTLDKLFDLDPNNSYKIITHEDNTYLVGGKVTWKRDNKQKTWGTFGEENFPNLSGFSLTRIDNSLYVFGGKTSDAKYSNEIYQMSLTDLPIRWNKIELSKGPKPRIDHVAVSYSSQLIVFGGCDDTNQFSDLWSFNLNTMTWELLVEFPARFKRFGHQAVVKGNNLLVFGGQKLSTGLFISLAEKKCEEIQILGNYLPSLHNFSLVPLDNGNLISIGGNCGQNFLIGLCSLIEIPDSLQGEDSNDIELDHRLQTMTLEQIEELDKQKLLELEKAKKGRFQDYFKSSISKENRNILFVSLALLFATLFSLFKLSGNTSFILTLAFLVSFFVSFIYLRSKVKNSIK